MSAKTIGPPHATEHQRKRLLDENGNQMGRSVSCAHLAMDADRVRRVAVAERAYIVRHVDDVDLIQGLLYCTKM